MDMIIENTKSLLLEHKSKGHDPGEEEGRTFVQLGPKGSRAPFLCGGAGYTIDRVGLKKLHDYMPKCTTKAIGYWEDNAITLCVQNIGLVFDDNRDNCSGQQQSHTVNPGTLFDAQALSENELDKRMKY